MRRDLGRLTKVPEASHIWPVWTLRVLGVSLAVDILLVALAGPIAGQASSCDAGSSGSGLGGLLAFIWLFGPAVALIVAGRWDERRDHVPGAEGYAMGGLATIVLTHALVAGFMLAAGPSCGFLMGLGG